jgi:hypothetical protein
VSLSFHEVLPWPVQRRGCQSCCRS